MQAHRSSLKTFLAVVVAVPLISEREARVSRQIRLKIFPDGQVKAEVLGFRGKKCADYISVLEQLLDAEAIDSERMPEYYLEESQVVEAPHFQTVERK